MADDRSIVTELATALGMLGYPGPTMALRARPAEFAALPDAVWERLLHLRAARRFDADFSAAFANGRAFLESPRGLRGRRPGTIEWRGAPRRGGDHGAWARAPGATAPADLRVDHVHLVSCRYPGPLLLTTAPADVFDDLLAPSGGERADWYGEVAPSEYQALYAAARGWLGRAGRQLPPSVGELQPADRAVLRTALAGRWPPELRSGARALSVAVAHASAHRWSRRINGARGAESMLWRLLRIGGSPYTIASSKRGRDMRLRVATSADWRQRFALRRLGTFPRAGVQPRVGWEAMIVARRDDTPVTVTGEVEIRWTRGRFSGPPVARVRLATPREQVPGYFPLEGG